MAARLRSADLHGAASFAFNVSNFNRTVDEEAYGEALSAKLGELGYVIDTSPTSCTPAAPHLEPMAAGVPERYGCTAWLNGLARS